MKNQSNFEPNSLGLSNESGKTLNNPQEIRQMQRALNRTLGLQLPIDGVLSFRTRKAIRNFQRQKGLPADGNVSPCTLHALLVVKNKESGNDINMLDESDSEWFESGWSETFKSEIPANECKRIEEMKQEFESSLTPLDTIIAEVEFEFRLAPEYDIADHEELDLIEEESSSARGVCTLNPPSNMTAGQVYRHQGRRRGIKPFRFRVSRGMWAVPASNSQGGPSSLWRMAERGIIDWTGIKPTNAEVQSYIDIIGKSGCNRHLSKSLSAAFLPHWDKTDRRKRIGGGGGYGVVFLPNNRKARKLFDRVRSRFYGGS